MKNIFKSVLFILLITAFHLSYSQEKKLTLAEKIPGWYRFEKGRHGLSFFAGLDGFEARDEEGRIYAHHYGTSLRLGYSYIPINSIVVNLDLLYGYSINSPHYDNQFFRSILGVSKTFFGKNKFFMGTGLDFVTENFWYRIHPEVPDLRYFGDTEFHKLNSHLMYYIKPNIYFGYFFGNNTTLQTGLGYNFYLGDKKMEKIMWDIKFTYFFPLKKK